MYFEKEISRISFLVFVILIPFSITWTNIFLFLSIFFTVIDKDLYQKFSLKKLKGEEKFFILCSSAYFFVCLISILWSEDKERGGLLVGRYVLIIVFPWLLSFMKAVGSLKDYKVLIYAFTIGVFISSFVCLYLSYLDCWHETGNGKVFNLNYYNAAIPFSETFSTGWCCFTYSFLSHFIHPAYYALYFLLVLLFLLNLFLKTSIKKIKIGIGVLSFYCIVFIFLLQSRAALVSLAIMILLFILYNAILKRRIKFTIVGFVVLISFSVIIVPYTRLNGILGGIENAMKRDKTQEFDNIFFKEKENIRILIWISALEIIKANPVLGVGIGDTDIELMKEYKKDKLNFELGTHNQYIYSQLGMGIMGLTLLLSMFFPAFYYGVKNKYFPLIAFAVVVMINLMFENMLTRSIGLMFIPWAMHLLLIMSNENNINSRFDNSLLNENY